MMKIKSQRDLLDQYEIQHKFPCNDCNKRYVTSWNAKFQKGKDRQRIGAILHPDSTVKKISVSAFKELKRTSCSI